MNELMELTENKTLPELERELKFQLSKGENIGGAICSHIAHEIGKKKVFDLAEKYQNNSSIAEGIKKLNLISSHPKFKIDQIIQFYGGYNDDILFQSKITGFDKNGGIYVLWDCYWFSIYDNDAKRKIKLVI